MPGKPHETCFPKERFTVKDRFGLNSKREGLNPTSGSYRQLYRQPVLLAGDSQIAAVTYFVLHQHVTSVFR